jgi:hypothetical protein
MQQALVLVFANFFRRLMDSFPHALARSLIRRLSILTLTSQRQKAPAIAEQRRCRYGSPWE